MTDLPVTGHRRPPSSRVPSAVSVASSAPTSDAASARTRRRVRESVESARRKRPRLRRSGARKSRRFKIALVAQSSQLFETFSSLGAGRGARRRARRSEECFPLAPRGAGLLLAIRRRDSRRALAQRRRRVGASHPQGESRGSSHFSRRARGQRKSGRHFTLHLADLPTSGSLRSLIQEARHQLLLNRKAGNLSRRLRETSRRLQVLGEIVATANSILEPRRVINVIMSQIQELIPSEAWSILLVDEETGELAFEMALGEKSSDLNDTRIKLGEGSCGLGGADGRARDRERRPARSAFSGEVRRADPLPHPFHPLRSADFPRKDDRRRRDHEPRRRLPFHQEGHEPAPDAGRARRHRPRERVPVPENRAARRHRRPDQALQLAIHQ